MPESFMVFDFGENEDAAQQARHRLEAWRLAFRLGDRVKFKFERTAPAGESAQPAGEPADGSAPPAEEPAAKKKSSAKHESSKTKAASARAPEPQPEPAKETPAPPDRLRLVIRLDFPGHEKLSFQRWFDRIPAEAPFQAAQKQVLRPDEEGFDSTSELFDNLD